MKYSDELLELVLGLGIDVSKGPTYIRYQLEDLLDETKDFTFGYLDRINEFEQPITIYGMDYFITLKKIHSIFMREYEQHLDLLEIKKELYEIKKTKNGIIK